MKMMLRSYKQKTMGIINQVRKFFANSSVRSFTTWATMSPTAANRYELMEKYKNLVYACVNLIAESLGQYKPLIKTENGKEIEHDFFKLLKKPSEEMSRYDLFYNSAAYWMLTGEFFWYFPVGSETARPKEIIVLSPDRVDVAVDENNGEVIGYVFNKSDGTQVPLDIYEIAHFKDFNPQNKYRGLGPVQAGLLYINTENATSEFQYNFINNSASPSGVLTVKGRIGKEAWNKVKRQWQNRNAGPENAGKTLFLREADASFEKIGLSLADLNLEQLKNITDERVRKIFRVSKFLLGEADASGLSRANAETAEYVFAKYTIEPKMLRLDNFIDQLINRFYKKDFDIIHKSIIPEDREFKLKMEQAGVDSWMTRNEIRRAQGLDDIDGGDKLFVGFNQIDIGSEPEPQVETQKTLVKLKTKKKSCDCGHDHQVKKAKNQSESQYITVIDQAELNSQRSYTKKMVDYLDQQEKAVVSMIQVELGEKKKAFEAITNPIDNIPVLGKLVEALTRLLFGTYKQGGVFGVEFIGDPDVNFITEQSARDSIFDSTERLMKSFNEETTLKIQKAIAAGVTEGEDIDKITKRVEDVYKEAKGFRAKRIAQTESHKAINFGTAEGYKQAGIKKMQWENDADPCEFCRAMNGTVVDIGTPFIPKGASVEGSEGGEYLADYDNVGYADLHPNCMCRLIPVK